MADLLRILILFSNPPDSTRLRLDKEDREIDMLVQQLGNKNVEVIRRHAASPSDFIELIGKGDFEIIHFSGHGNPDGIQLENPETGRGLFIKLHLLSNILSMQANSNLRVLMFMSCFSSAAVAKLAGYAPYLIAMEGSPADEETTVFVKHFYASYLQDHSVQRAFDTAQLHLSTRSRADAVKPVLIQRSRHNTEGKLIVEFKMIQYPDIMSIDLSSIEASLESLGLPKEEVLDMLARKIKIHAWIFAAPRDNAILSIGTTLIGDFSWNASANYIKCNRLYRIQDDIDPTHWQIWTRILLLYNDLCSEEYRLPHRSADPIVRKNLISKGLEHINTVHQVIKGDIDILIQMGLNKVGLSYSLASSYLELANTKFEQGDSPMTVAYLESALSSLHDVVNISTPKTLSSIT
ncbi:hypothetical protein BH10CHL1_BH10CHL1_06460 [soil metagenome]